MKLLIPSGTKLRHNRRTVGTKVSLIMQRHWNILSKLCWNFRGCIGMNRESCRILGGILFESTTLRGVHGPHQEKRNAS